ncbi:MAG TPA: hypothetical protein VFV84_09385 [Burkholderiales bacterium]|nr:hypothetical protein [Burkholderiales bacterium]
MKLRPYAFAVAAGLLWGGALLLVSLAHAIWPPYGGAFLSAVASVYPGYAADGGASIIVAALYGLVDGGIAGLILAWLYNLLADKFTHGA